MSHIRASRYWRLRIVPVWAVPTAPSAAVFVISRVQQLRAHPRAHARGLDVELADAQGFGSSVAEPLTLLLLLFFLLLARPYSILADFDHLSEHDGLRRMYAEPHASSGALLPPHASLHARRFACEGGDRIGSGY